MVDAPQVTNEQIASYLDEMAINLADQHANPFRVDAYRAGAQVIRDLPESVQELSLSEGRAGLGALPHIGKSLAAAVDEIAHTGRLRALDRLRGHITPVELFQTVPGIGEELADRIHRELHLDTLEDLEVAVHDGRLDTLAGFGPRRLQAVANNLATMLARSSRRKARRFDELREAGANVAPPKRRRTRPPVAILLEIDHLYRTQAKTGSLPRIAPNRNNPGGKAWLPILHTEQDAWHFTVMFSNTDRAHELGRTRDWVILYYDRDGHEDQCTVVTETRGRLAGQRVVRGREDACAKHYRRLEKT